MMRQKIAAVAGIFVIFALLGGSIALYGHTLVNPVTVICVAVAVALVLCPVSIKLFKRISPTLNRLVAFLIHMVTLTSVTLFAIFALNYFCANEDSAKDHEAVVVSRYSEEHTSGSTGRRHHHTQRKYRVYYIRLRFDNGRTKDVQISLNRYNRTRIGEKYTIKVSDGLFGMPVVKAFP